VAAVGRDHGQHAVALKIEATGRLANESIAPEAAGYTTGIPPLAATSPRPR